MANQKNGKSFFFEANIYLRPGSARTFFFYQIFVGKKSEMITTPGAAVGGATFTFAGTDLNTSSFSKQLGKWKMTHDIQKYATLMLRSEFFEPFV